MRFDGVETAPAAHPVCAPKFGSDVLQLLIDFRFTELALSSPIIRAPQTVSNRTMPRPSKRVRKGQRLAGQSVLARTVSTTRNIAIDWEVPDSGPSEGELSEEEVESSSDSEEEITAGEPEDSDSDNSDSEWECNPDAVRHTVGIQQPQRGWKEVERAAPGHSKTNAGKTDQSRYYYRQKEKQKEEARKELQRTYGDISRFFIRPPPPSATVLPLSPVIPAEINFETAFFSADSFVIEAQHLPSSDPRSTARFPPCSRLLSTLLATKSYSILNFTASSTISSTTGVP